jgi:hypothetical protein
MEAKPHIKCSQWNISEHAFSPSLNWDEIQVHYKNVILAEVYAMFFSEPKVPAWADIH